MTTTFVGLTIHPFEPKRHQRCVLRKDARLIAEALTIKQLQLGFSKAQNLPWLVASQNGFLDGFQRLLAAFKFHSIQFKKQNHQRISDILAQGFHLSDETLDGIQFFQRLGKTFLKILGVPGEVALA